MGPVSGGGQLLVSQVGIINGGDTNLVPFTQHASEFTAERVDSARDDQCGVPEINNSDLATLLKSPTMTKLGRQVGLPPV